MDVLAIGIDNTPNMEEQLRNRIKSKQVLWDFIWKDLWTEIENWHSSPEELTLELTKVATRILHPHFTTSEMPGEIENLLNTLKTRKPANFLTIVTDDTIKRILGKLK